MTPSRLPNGRARMFAALALRGRTAPYYRGQALYRVFLIAMGLASYAALALWLRFSTSGLYARAVNQDPSVARMMGVDADRLSLLLISLSAAFAGVAGVLAGPYLSVDPGMDVSMIVNCLIIVVIDGTRSIAGAIVAALLFGFVLVAGSVLLPDLAALAPYVLLFALLLIAPRQSARLHDADPRCRRDDQQWLG